MKKIIICISVIFVLLNICSTSYAKNELNNDILESQKDSLNVQSFIKEANTYTKDVFSDTDMGNMLNSAISGKMDNRKIFTSIWNLLGKDFTNCMITISSIIAIVVIHSILKSISDGLENKGVSEVAYYVQYILIVTIIVKNFAEVLDLVKNSIDNLVGFMNSLIPILVTLMITTGSISGGSIMQPILLFMVTFIGNFIKNIIIPIILVSTALAIVSKISSKIQIDKLSKYFKSTVVWVLGVVLTLFVGILSVEGSLANSVDGVTAKTSKAAVSTLIPFVGKILGDAIDSVIGCGMILKNALGAIGTVIIIGICIKPIIKLVILMAMYYLLASLCQPIADDKIIKLLEQMGETFKILLAVMASSSAMAIIGITLVVKITNV